MNKYGKDFENLAFREVYYGLSKTIESLNTYNMKNALKNELLNMLKKCKEELKIEEDIPEILVDTRGNKAYFQFRDAKTGKNIFLFNEWLRKKKSNGGH